MTNAQLVSALNDALNKRDENEIAGLFSEDCLFLSSRAGRQLTGPAGAAGAMMTWLNQYVEGSVLETIRQFYVGAEGYHEWRFTAKDLEGNDVTMHGVDYFQFADGKISVKNSFVKV